jgi:phospholipid/cholesterol/gamma-HCH transport system substrate-binding protein
MNAIREDKNVARGAIAIVALLALAVMSYKGVIPKLLSGESRKPVTAQFADVGQLKVGDPVRADGVKVGRVDRIRRASGSTATTVTMGLNEDVLPLHRDASAKVAIRGLLAGTFYVALDPGTAPSGDLASGAIDERHTMGQIEAEDLTAAFQGEARAGLTKLPGELSQTFADPHLPERTLQKLSDVAPKVTDALHGVRGAELDEDLKGLIAASAKTAANFDAPRDELRILVSGAASTLQTTAARADDLRFIFARSPAIQQRVRATLTRLSATLEGADPLVSELKRSAGDLGPTLAAFRPPVEDTDALLRSAVPLLRSLRPASRAVAQAATSGNPALDGLDPSLDRLADTILPYMNKKQAETQLTPAQAVGPFFSSWGGAAAQTDANGHMFRFPASGGEGLLSNDLFCQTHLTDPKAAALVACDKLADAVNTFLTYSPYKVPGADNTPGTAGATTKKRGGR